ncbi:type I-C CRISPR-associated protein Cas8c/Csd1 [Trichlorobacter ammonificans]|uniref:CRISPR-associated protein Csd1 n=1 Tax=Trichlorobacter ammonificans TaxID=2916410 RepID=A0ABM9D6A3_9BACT|nr:type I-C CRISPR-associated protein Cas8c/Csd1 [Trichlorobacter ammonificans]CAH2030724.1 CRISPR-associated protein Csd1 [Trichlorobacter ammonificans]
MSWIEKLYQTYENNLGSIADPNDTIPLLPLFHTTQNAQLHVVLDGEGNLAAADVVAKENSQTIIPATEASAGRAGAKIAPHALCDTLQYVAGDYLDYGGNPNKKKNESGFEPYIKALSGWVTGANNRKLASVLTYLKKGTLIQDLVRKKVLYADGSGKLAANWQGEGEAPPIFKVIKQANKKGQFEAFVRFSVEIPGVMPTELWKDDELRNSWAQYYPTLQSVTGICMVTGNNGNIACNHPKNIRYPGDGAKLISSNDTEGYTYLGRFTSDLEACGIGIEVTQKAHSALRWLIKRQGKQVDEQAVVTWAVSGADIPDPQADTLSFLFGNNREEATPKTSYTAQEVGDALRKKIAGYSATLKGTDNVVVLALDSASPGRMAISYYRELAGSEFLSRIEAWHTTCCWQQYFGKDRIFYGAPAPRDISEVAYGRRIDDKLRKATVERLLPCIVDAAPVPRDLVESCIRRASNRNGIEYWEWEKALGIACALYRKQNEKEEYGMALDEERSNRDYLYGRLLALAEHLEHWAIRAAGENRPTNAERMMQRFADHPYTTWRTLEHALMPYKIRLGGKAHKVLTLIDIVHSKFDPPEEYTRDDRLSGEYLLGYHCQRAALRSVVQPEGADDNPETAEENDTTD